MDCKPLACLAPRQCEMSKTRAARQLAAILQPSKVELLAVEGSLWHLSSMSQARRPREAVCNTKRSLEMMTRSP